MTQQTETQQGQASAGGGDHRSKSKCSEGVFSFLKPALVTCSFPAARAVLTQQQDSQPTSLPGQHWVTCVPELSKAPVCRETWFEILLTEPPHPQTKQRGRVMWSRQPVYPNAHPGALPYIPRGGVARSFPIWIRSRVNPAEDCCDRSKCD